MPHFLPLRAILAFCFAAIANSATAQINVNGLMVFPEAKSHRYRAKGIKGRQVDSLLVFAPLSGITQFERRTEAIFNDSLSAIAAGQLSSALQAEARRMRASPVHELTDPVLRQRYEDEVVVVLIPAMEKRYAGALEPTPVIDSMTRAAGMRYALLTMQRGFVRTDKPSVVGGGLVGSAIGGGPSSFYSFLPASSEVCFAVVDVEGHKMMFFIRDDFSNLRTPANPTLPNVARRHVLRAFHQFYWLAPQDML